jgi:hypothetical protein
MQLLSPRSASGVTQHAQATGMRLTPDAHVHICQIAHLSMRSRTRRRNSSLSSTSPSAVSTSSRRVFGPICLTSTCRGAAPACHKDQPDASSHCAEPFCPSCKKPPAAVCTDPGQGDFRSRGCINVPRGAGWSCRGRQPPQRHRPPGCPGAPPCASA